MQSSVLTLDRVSDLVHDLFKAYARRAADDYETFPVARGTLVEDTLQDIGFDVEVVDSLLAVLAARHARDMHHDPGDDWYETGTESFELAPTASDSSIYEWTVFVEQVRHHGRFFNEWAKQYLDGLFGPILRGELHRGTPPIVRLGAPDSSIREIYRARVANTRRDQAAIYENPRRELSPPPKHKRRANRMNAEGVPAFYGALDVQTCVAELRPMVHGCAIVGKFGFFRPVDVLDLRLVDNATQALSWFDPDFSEKYAAGAFVRNLHDIIRTPVFPEAGLLEYLPTQVIAEYLATRGLGGVLYVSSLIDRPKPFGEDGLIRLRDVDDAGVNVVLFSRSCIVAGAPDEVEWDVVRVDPPPSGDLIDTQYVERNAADDQARWVEEYPLVDDALEPTLIYEEDSLSIVSVKGIKHDLVVGRVEFFVRDSRSTASTISDGARAGDGL